MQATRATGLVRVLGLSALFALFAAGFSVTAAGLRAVAKLPGWGLRTGLRDRLGPGALPWATLGDTPFIYFQF